MKRLLPLLILLFIAAYCVLVPRTRTASTAQPASGTLTADEMTTLRSLKLVDGHPLYTMHYQGSYDGLELPSTGAPVKPAGTSQDPACGAAWACSLFAALGSETDRLVGRNFDWDFSPAVLLFTDPPGAYASVSMVDIAYLGFTGAGAGLLSQRPIDELRPLLYAPALPFDGMNERGLAITMAAVPPGYVRPDPRKGTLDELQVMREILDHAATVDEALRILAEHNIDMGSVPIHYLIASASGQSAVVEFYAGRMVVLRNAESWQAATNFLLASTGEQPEGHCWRYDRINRALMEAQGNISPADALDLLSEVAQDQTQWSVVYHLTSGEVDVVLGRRYAEGVHTFNLQPDAPED